MLRRSCSAAPGPASNGQRSLDLTPMTCKRVRPPSSPLNGPAAECAERTSRTPLKD
jgi:hypothetical protein